MLSGKVISVIKSLYFKDVFSFTLILMSGFKLSAEMTAFGLDVDFK